MAGRVSVRVLRLLAGLAVLIGAAIVASVLIGDGRASQARTPGRGEPVALPSAVAALAPALDPQAAVAPANAIRGEAAVGALSASECLDAAAAATAAQFVRGATPDRLAAVAGCDIGAGPGAVRWGWVSGADPTGAAQLRGAWGRGLTGPSALAAPEVARIGLSLAKQTDAAGRVTGFVLVWAVSA